MDLNVFFFLANVLLSISLFAIAFILYRKLDKEQLDFMLTVRDGFESIVKAQLVPVLDAKLKEVEKNVEKFKDAAALLEKVDNLTKEQQILLQQHSLPSTNALHSQHKNDIVRQLKNIETEKNEYLKQVFTLGINPPISYFNKDTKQIEKIKLSEYLEKLPQVTETKIVKKEDIKKSIFKVISNNKGDSNE